MLRSCHHDTVLMLLYTTLQTQIAETVHQKGTVTTMGEDEKVKP